MVVYILDPEREDGGVGKRACGTPFAHCGYSATLRKCVFRDKEPTQRRLDTITCDGNYYGLIAFHNTVKGVMYGESGFV